MRITGSNLTLNGGGEQLRAVTERTRLEAWVGERPTPAASVELSSAARQGDSPKAAPQAPLVYSLAMFAAGARLRGERAEAQRLVGGGSDTRARPARHDSQPPVAAPGEVPRKSVSSNLDDVIAQHPDLIVFVGLIERMTGQKIRLVDPRAAAGPDTEAASLASPDATASQARTPPGSPPPERAGWGLEITSERVVATSERSWFEASGSVRTADGRELDFDVRFARERAELTVERFELRAGDAVVKDPLVLSFGGTPAALSNATAELDLDGDGALERFHFVDGTGAYLVHDADGNGRVDGGHELVGATTGDGFGELAALDDDRNGWLDEGDAAWSKLALWRSPNTSSLEALGAAGVGAIATGAVQTPFSLRTGEETTGFVREAGLWLSESGTPGLVEHLDVATTPVAPNETEANVGSPNEPASRGSPGAAG